MNGRIRILRYIDMIDVGSNGTDEAYNYINHSPNNRPNNIN